jgi:hypothetical protein
MKKWMIIAVVAALFMVMFPACGGDDDGGDDAVADNVRAVKVGSNVLVTWTGSVGSDYAVYYQEKSQSTDVGGGTQATRGQRQFKYVLNTSTKAVDITINDDEVYWSVWSDDSNSETGNTLNAVVNSGTINGVSVGPLSGNYRFGVGPALTGGFRRKNLPIVWDNENLPQTDATAQGVDAKDYGFITF